MANIKQSPTSSGSSAEISQTPGLHLLDNVVTALQNPVTWHDFKLWLREQSEGSDSEGKEMTLERYAIFFELHLEFYNCFDNPSSSETPLYLYNRIMSHSENFFGKYRFLSRLNKEQRQQILTDYKNIQSGKLKPSKFMFSSVPSIIHEHLDELLREYKKYVIAKNNI